MSTVDRRSFEDTAWPDDGDRTTVRDLTGVTLGDFKIEKLLGRGGMGEVYLATQLSLSRPVALKVLQSNLASNPTYLGRLRTRSDGGRQAQSSQYRPRLYIRLRRPDQLHRDGVRPGDEPEGVHHQEGRARSAAGVFDHAADRSGDRRGRRGWPGPPRCQARKHLDDEERAGEGRRFRAVPRPGK